MKCEYCNNNHDGTFGSGRFCNQRCASGFSTKNKRKEINEKVSNSLKGRNEFIWNKDIDNRVIIYCSICGKKRKVYKNSNIKTCGNKNCKNIQLSISLKGKTGGYRKGAGRSNGSYYKNQYFDSPYEIEVAKFLDKNKIKWKRNTKRFYYIFEGEKTYYIPDFVIDNNIYLETKGYWYSNKKEKTLEAVKQNNLNWILFMQKTEWNINKNLLLEKIETARRTI